MLLIISVNSSVSYSFNGSVISFGGLPKSNGYPNEITILNKGVFVIGYDETKKCPIWVVYKVFRVDDYKLPKRPSKFVIDFERACSPHDGVHLSYDVIY